MPLLAILLILLLVVAAVAWFAVRLLERYLQRRWRARDEQAGRRETTSVRKN